MDAQDPTKVRLLEAAGEEFAGNGFESARIRRICERAGANLAAVNYHFGDKSQLYVERSWLCISVGSRARKQRNEKTCRRESNCGCFIHHFLDHVLAINQILTTGGIGLLLREMMHPTSASDVLIREIDPPQVRAVAKRSSSSFCRAWMLAS